MFVLLPVHTDNPIRRTPLVNYGLIAVNVLIFLAGWPVLVGQAAALARFKTTLVLWADHPAWYQFFSSMFLHENLGHLIGNMIFLWVFGNSLNQKLGGGCYLMFYLACGLLAGVGYSLARTAPMLGASGAIFGVAAGFLVLFPLSRVTVLYWLFFFFGFLEFSGLTVVGCFIAYNLIYTLTGAKGGVAYQAHLAGAAAGLALGMLLLACRAIGRDQFDLLALLSRWRRRRVFAAHPGQPDADRGPSTRTVRSRQLDSRPLDGATVSRIAELRAGIGEALRAGNATRAGELYRDLVRLDENQVLPQGQQLELANLLTSAGQHALAVESYEAFVRRYPAYEFIEQVELLLGVIYARYLNNPIRARHYLERCQGRLGDPNQRAMCREELARVAARLGE